MAGATVTELNNNLISLTEELTILTASITSSFNTFMRDSNKATVKDLTMKKDIREFIQKADSYDRQFEEEESRLQAFGGKGRKQTLQEFVLLFFYLAYGILSFAIIMYAYRANIEGYTMKVFGLLAFILLLITGMILKYT
jgi:hypothetical protein